MSSEKDTATVPVVMSEVPLAEGDVLREVEVPVIAPQNTHLEGAVPTTTTSTVITGTPAARRLSAGEAFAEEVGIDLDKIGRAEARKLMSVEHKVLGFRPPRDSLAAAAQAAISRHPNKAEDGSSDGDDGKILSVDAEKLKEAAQEDAQRILAKRTKQSEIMPASATSTSTSSIIAAIDTVPGASTAKGDADEKKDISQWEKEGVDLEQISIEDARTLMSVEHRALGFRPPPGSLAAEAQAAATKAASLVARNVGERAARQGREMSGAGHGNEQKPRQRRYSNQPVAQARNEGKRRSASMEHDERSMRRVGSASESGRNGGREETLRAAAVRDAERIRATRGLDGASASEHAHVDVQDLGKPKKLKGPSESDSQDIDSGSDVINLQREVQRAKEVTSSEHKLANPSNDTLPALNDKGELVTTSPSSLPVGNHALIFKMEDLPQQHEGAVDTAVAYARVTYKQEEIATKEACMVSDAATQAIGDECGATGKQEWERVPSEVVRAAVEAAGARRESEGKAGGMRNTANAAGVGIGKNDAGGESGEDIGQGDEELGQEGGYAGDVEDEDGLEAVRDEKTQPILERSETTDSVQIIGDVLE